MICLASQSPRRAELLGQIGIPFRTLSTDVDESVHPGESPQAYVLRLAEAKARTAAALQDLPVLAADTSVIIDEKILGKPRDLQDFLEMMQLLGNKTHQVMTGIAVFCGKMRSRVTISQVSFTTISQQQARLYWETGEPRDKAGGYAIQGKAAIFIKEIQGSYSGIMGLPLYETAELLRQCGIESLTE